MEMPSFNAVLQKVEYAIEKFHATNGLWQVTELDVWEFQEITIIALQTMIPPLRGRPYWDLELLDNGSNSMFQSKSPVSVCKFYRLCAHLHK
jgi:hypothetical protein